MNAMNMQFILSEQLPDENDIQQLRVPATRSTSAPQFRLPSLHEAVWRQQLKSSNASEKVLHPSTGSAPLPRPSFQRSLSAEVQPRASSSSDSRKTHKRKQQNIRQKRYRERKKKKFNFLQEKCVHLDKINGKLKDLIQRVLH